jgi:hypothetical protein
MALPCHRIARLGAGPHLRFLHHQMGAMGKVVPGRQKPTCPVGLYRLTAFSRMKRDETPVKSRTRSQNHGNPSGWVRWRRAPQQSRRYAKHDRRKVRFEQSPA